MSKTDFEADSILVEKTTEWKALISREELPNKVLGSAASALNYSRSVKEFIGKKFTLAIVLNKDGKRHQIIQLIVMELLSLSLHSTLLVCVLKQLGETDV